jgi:hypothetical protein
LTLENLQAIHSGNEKKKMSKWSSTTADKQITGDPLNFFCTAEALWLTEKATTVGIILSSTYKPLFSFQLCKVISFVIDPKYQS